MSANRPYSLSLRNPMQARQCSQDEEREKDTVIEEGKERIRKARKTRLGLPHPAQAERQREHRVNHTTQDRSHQCLQGHESDYTACSCHTDILCDPVRLHWRVRYYLTLAAVAVSFCLIARHVSLSPSGRAMGKTHLQEKALVESPPVVPATELGEHLDACILQILHMINTLHRSHVADFLPLTFSKELEHLEHDMNNIIALSSKHQPSIDTSYMLYRIFTADQDCIRVDASFNEYKLDQFHNLQTLFCVYTQDTINKYNLIIHTANQSVSKPFFSSRERAALVKAEVWFDTTSELSTEVNDIQTHLTAVATGPLTLTVPHIVILATHLFNATMLVTQPRPSLDIKALLGLSPALSTPPAVNLTATLEVITNAARTATHLLYSIDAACAILTKLQRVLGSGPWVNTRVVTAEQCAAREKEMRVWMLEVRDRIADLGVDDWRQLDWA